MTILPVRAGTILRRWRGSKSSRNGAHATAVATSAPTKVRPYANVGTMAGGASYSLLDKIVILSVGLPLALLVSVILALWVTAPIWLVGLLVYWLA